MESVHMVLAVAANNHLVLKQLGIKTAFLHAIIPEEAEPTYVIPPKGFPCSLGQAKQVWLLKAWLYGLRLSPKGWNVDLGDAKFLLGMAIQRHLNAGTLLLTQEAYTKACWLSSMADAHPTKTPAEVEPITTAEDEVLSPEDTKNFRSATVDYGDRSIPSRWTVDWRAAKQPLVAVSSVEPEYVRGVVQGLPAHHPLPRPLKTINRAQKEATVIYEDNSGAILTSLSSKITPRTKHIDIKYHHIRSLIQDGVVKVEKIESAMQKADMFTKSLGAVKFIKNSMMLLRE
ncbi:unnamed protein product [Ectocarpus sp. CCAP 1310/34]|nr:unnamed protein product [Ectocarpus sp. CCAP 1310/34]